MATGQELTYDTGASATEMAETIMGEGVTVVDADYDGSWYASAIYSDGDSIAAGPTPSDSGVILSTGYVGNFTQSWGDPNRSDGTSTNTSGDNNNPLLNNAANASTYDASILTIDFIPEGDTMTMQFVFASEEYPEFTGSEFSDVVAVYINGELVTSPVIDVTQINSINQTENANLFVDNTGDDHNTEMDGFTVTLSLQMDVNPNEVNELIIAIADVADSSYDSNLLIAADSAQTAFIANDDAIAHYEGQTAIVDALANDGSAGVMTITHVNGQEISVGETITLPSGHAVTLLADGTLQVVPPADQTNLVADETVNFTYTVENEDGITDTAFVTVTAIPCFVRGTLIRTPGGDVPIETLGAGDLVETRDNGPQPLRWIGSRRVPAEGRFRPVVIEAGTFGLHTRLVVSPQHRVLLRHWMAELMFGEDEVLVAAKDLVNECSVRFWDAGGEVEYFHLLFDRHQIVWSEGLETESFQPGPYVMDDLEAAVRDEVLALFPQIDPENLSGYGPAARTTLKAHEARLLAG